mmetsp:Transcript_20401/g.29927  ORF Transcript_20401/g.29927 Transcript_20401/m.29927 type:complete len:227 (-) Transcript_20401:49-729(-)
MWRVAFAVCIRLPSDCRTCSGARACGSRVGSSRRGVEPLVVVLGSGGGRSRARDAENSRVRFASVACAQPKDMDTSMVRETRAEVKVVNETNEASTSKNRAVWAVIKSCKDVLFRAGRANSTTYANDLASEPDIFDLLMIHTSAAAGGVVVAAIKPELQEHCVLASSENELIPHVLHLIASSAYVPATQRLQLVAPAGATEPTGHATHSTLLDRANAYLPLLHIVQ